MSEEKEKDKEKKPLSVLTELSNIGVGLSEAMRAQAQIMQSSIAQQALQSARIFDSFNGLSSSFKTMASINNMIREHQAIIPAFQQPPIMKTMLEYQTGISILAKQLVGINKMIQSVKMPKIAIPTLSTELAVIPRQNDTLVRSLLREIELLEKELAKEKAENKQLMALLEEKRKELKKQYVT
jgi:hypothetical protein